MILADILSVIAWCAILTLALTYRRRSDGRALWPMQWGLDGKPTWRARRDVAVFFHPVFFGLLLGLFACRWGASANMAWPQEWVSIRIAFAGAAVLACWLHLRYAARQLSPT